MVRVFYTDEFGSWFDALDEQDGESIGFVIDLLAEEGIGLGYPHSSALQGSRYALRELRPKRGRSPLRVVYAFDPRRDSVLIIGGDKGGDPSFYERIIGRAERIWEEYLVEARSGRHDKGGDDEAS